MSEKILVNAPDIRWQYKSGQITFKITNTSGGRLAFKIKISDAAIYSAVPVYGFLEDKESQNVTVLRADAPLKEDSLVILFCEATAADADSQEIFKRPDVKKHHKTIKMREKQ